MRRIEENWQFVGATDICKGTVRGILGRNQIMGDSEAQIQEFIFIYFILFLFLFSNTLRNFPGAWQTSVYLILLTITWDESFYYLHYLNE